MEAETRQAPPESQPRNGAGNPDLLRFAPGLARIAVSAWWRTTGWTVGASLRVGSRVVRAAVSGENPADLFQAAGAEVREWARRVLEVVEAEAREDEPPIPPVGADGAPDNESLREMGTELLRQSADVGLGDDAHPAYARILGELAPDEGRILRLMALEGPQPAVDVRAGMLPVGVGSELVALGLTMIGAEAGVRHGERVPAYLNNLFRLGLIWFSREQIGSDPSTYQVLESQPEVIDAMKEARRSRTVRRSIHLTPFGSDFCDMCLPIHTGEIEALPGTGEPPEEDRPPAPSRDAGDPP